MNLVFHISGDDSEIRIIFDYFMFKKTFIGKLNNPSFSCYAKIKLLNSACDARQAVELLFRFLRHLYNKVNTLAAMLHIKLFITNH